MASGSVLSPANHASSANLLPITYCVVVVIAKANSSGGTSAIYAMKLNSMERIVGDPFRLYHGHHGNALYIWQNETITKERIRFGSVLKYEEFGDLFIYRGSTKKKRQKVDQIQMNLDYDESVYKSIKEVCPDAIFGTDKGIYLKSIPKSPRIFLVTLKYGVIANERLIFQTKEDLHIANLKLNCRENLTLSTSPVYLQMRPVRGEGDVGDVALIRFDTAECDLRSPVFPAVCEGLILKHKPKIISTDEEPVKIWNGEGKKVFVPGSVKFDTGNDVATAISNDLVEKLDLKPDQTKKVRLTTTGGIVLQCYTVEIILRIRMHVFKVNALVGAVAPGTDLLIGQDIIAKLNDKNFAVGE